MNKSELADLTGMNRLKSTFKQREKIILRDFLAMERTTLANERTLFAYIRSSIYLAITGITILSLPELHTLKWLSYILFPVAGVMVIYGVFRFQVLKRKLSVFYKAMQHEESKDEIRRDKSTESES